jgi:hypothetical protein
VLFSCIAISQLLIVCAVDRFQFILSRDFLYLLHPTNVWPNRKPTDAEHSSATSADFNGGRLCDNSANEKWRMTNTPAALRVELIKADVQRTGDGTERVPSRIISFSVYLVFILHRRITKLEIV